MIKQTLRFDAISCRLQLEGLPDVSSGQSGDRIGIITGWTLQWAGRPELEGRKEHLLALMQTVLPYARMLISGVERPRGNGQLPVDIAPMAVGHHQLRLRSSQPDTPALELDLDDAELADLVRVLDQLRLDPRLVLPLELPADVPLRAREVQGRIPRRQRFAAPAAAVALLAAGTALSLLWPTPKPLAPPGTNSNSSGKLAPPR